MNHRTTPAFPALSRLAIVLAVAGAVTVSASAAPAPPGPAPAPSAAAVRLGGDSQELTVPLYKSKIIDVPFAAGRVAVGNPDVADIVIIRPTQLYVLGKAVGTTNVLVWSKDGDIVRALDVEVAHDLEGLKAKLHQLLPGEPIEVRSAQRSIVLSGRVSDAGRMATAVKLAEGYLAQMQTAKQKTEFQMDNASQREDKAVGQVINLLEVGGSQQVMLEVKVAEVKRDELKRLNAQFYSMLRRGNSSYGGVNGGATQPDAIFVPENARHPALSGDAPWGPAIKEFKPNDPAIINQGLVYGFLNGDFLFNLALDAAKQHGAAKILAEPTLTTLTGQEAQFLSGGEFPIPVPQGGAVSGSVTIEFKEFGVSLRFLPVVLSNNQINLKLNISVSELSAANSIGLQSNGVTSTFVIPSLAKRAASATVEVADGETIGIAGLISESTRSSITKFPGLGDVPVLGALFRSEDFQKGQTELLIIVTPRLAKPLPKTRVPLPTDGFTDPTDAEFYLMGRVQGSAASAPTASPSQR